MPSSDPRLTRRDVLAAGAVAATGYALAARPVSAEAVATPAEGLDTGDVEVAVPNAPMPAYRAAPRGAGPFPVVLVVHEIFGVHEYIRDVCRRLAHQGYLALAPDLYRRHGDPTRVTEVQTLLETIVRRVPDPEVMSDLDAALVWARAHGGDPERAFVTGFCWGGRIVWLYAAHRPELSAGVAWYGRLTGAARPETPRHPMDLAEGPLAPVMGLYGSADQGIPVASVEAMRKKLVEAGADAKILLFPGAPHGFHADYRSSFQPGAARVGWQRLLAWFAAHGGVPVTRTGE